MVAAGLPTVQVQLDDVNNGGTWPYDITTYAWLDEGYTLSMRGSADESSSISPVVLTLSLNNTDGRFTFGSTTGGYGAINIDRGIRVKVTPSGGSASTRFTGYVQEWPVAWPSGSDQASIVQVTAVDAVARWQRRTLRSIPEEQVFAANPLFYYTMGEPAGSLSAYDSSGNNRPPLVAVDESGSNGPAPVFGNATGAPTDGMTAATFSNPGLNMKAVASTLPLPTLAWCVVTFLVPATTGYEQVLLNTQYSLDLKILLAGNLTYGGVVTTGASVCNGNLHTAGLRDTGGNVELYYDGALVGSTAGSLGQLGYVDVGLFLTGTLCHIAGGGTDPGSAWFGRYNAAIKTGFANETSNARIQRLAQYEGTVTAFTFDAGQTNVPFLDTTGKSLAEAIQTVSDAEMGSTYIDGQGRAAIHNRTRGPLKVTPDLTLAVSSDAVSPDTHVQIDMQQVVNYATGSTSSDTSTTQVFTSASSTAIHGRYPETYEFQVSTQSEVLDRISWMVNTHAEPTPRLPELTLDLLTADASVQASVLALDIDSRLKITGMPSQTPGGTTLDLAVLGYSESLSADGWTWTANTYSWPAYVSALVLDDTSYGVLDSMRLGV